MSNKVAFTEEEMKNIEIGMGIAKRVVKGFAKVNSYLDTGAIEGDIAEYLMKIVKNYDSDKNDSFESFATLCIRNKLRNLKRFNKYLNYTAKHCVADVVTNDDGEVISLIDEAVTVEDVAETYLNTLDKLAFNKATDEAMVDIYTGATTVQLKIVKMYLSGMTLTEIAKALNFKHHMKVSRELQKLRKVIKVNPFEVKMTV